MSNTPKPTAPPKPAHLTEKASGRRDIKSAQTTPLNPEKANSAPSTPSNQTRNPNVPRPSLPVLPNMNVINTQQGFSLTKSTSSSYRTEQTTPTHSNTRSASFRDTSPRTSAKSEKPKLSKLMVVHFDKKPQTMEVDLNSLVSDFLNQFIDNKSKDCTSEFVYLSADENGKKELLRLNSFMDQGIHEGSSVWLKKRTKKEVLKNQKSVKNIHRATKSQTAEGATLVVVQPFNEKDPKFLLLKKGDQIKVLEEDPSGFWKGQVGERVGIFPVKNCQYIKKTTKVVANERTQKELQEGFEKFGSTALRKKQHKTSFFGGFFKGLWGSSHQNSRKTFDFSTCKVPPIIEETISYLEKVECWKTEGIFRVSGSQKEIFLAKHKYEKKKPVNLEQIHKLHSIHTVAGITKVFLRESEPLFTFELYESFIEAIRIIDPKGRKNCLLKVLDLLPPTNKAITERLFGFFVLLIQNHQTSKMTSEAIGKIFGPSLLRPRVETLETITSPEPTALIVELLEDFDSYILRKTKVETTNHDISEHLAPDFFRQLQTGKSHIENAVKEEQQTMRDNKKNGPPPKEETTMEDLVAAHIEGNTKFVEDYLQRLPENQRSDVRKEIQTTAERIHTGSVIYQDDYYEEEEYYYEEEEEYYEEEEYGEEEQEYYQPTTPPKMSPVLAHKPPNINTTNKNKSVNGILMTDLVNYMVSGNEKVEKYLQKFPPNQQEKELELLMDKMGFEKVN